MLSKKIVRSLKLKIGQDGNKHASSSNQDSKWLQARINGWDLKSQLIQRKHMAQDKGCKLNSNKLAIMEAWIMEGCYQNYYCSITHWIKWL